MIMRALFWIAVVAVLMPREPDLGLGRPGAGGGIWSALGAAVEPGQKVCDGNALACMAAGGVIGKMHGAVTASLSDVKAQFDAARKDRKARGLPL